jgi:hypothetical protein
MLFLRHGALGEHNLSVDTENAVSWVARPDYHPIAAIFTVGTSGAAWV